MRASDPKLLTSLLIASSLALLAVTENPVFLGSLAIGAALFIATEINQKIKDDEKEKLKAEIASIRMLTDKNRERLEELIIGRSR